MFDIDNSYYKKIISCIGIIGYNEEDIKNNNTNDYNKLPLNCLYSFPKNNDSAFNSLTYGMMFPNGDRSIECPKFFTLSLTNDMAHHSFLYCLKFSEKYKFIPPSEEKELENYSPKIKKTKSEEINFNKYKEIQVPIVICILSEKNDTEPFRQLLYVIHQIIINDHVDNDKTIINHFKKIELMNLFYFLFCLPHISPHTQINLKLNLSENIIYKNEKKDFDLIDFYFSSNCEIPCNKNDSNIELLFKILDQTIIIKVLFAILTEKQIILRASEAYLLHIIIPTFLKLIFPFVWIQTCITILPKDDIDYLDKPGSYIIGILSSTISIKELLKEYPGKIIVDCDTNEIIDEEIYIPFYPSQNNNNKKEDKNSINEKKDNAGGISQGKNTFIIDGCYLYEFVPNFNNIIIKNRKKLKINCKNNIIIDVNTSKLLTYRNNSYINSEEWKWLRKHIQMVRNPEIFDLGNIIKRKSSLINVFFDNTKISPIMPERSFSYNIQNILMIFLLNKLNYPESDFMTYFKTSNLYINYSEPKKYQNNSGKYIVENIYETKSNQRSYNNCFVIEYNLKLFNINKILEHLQESINKFEKENEINNENKNYSKYLYLKKLKKILKAYSFIIDLSLGQKNEQDFEVMNIDKRKLYKRKSFKIPKRNNFKFNNKNNNYYFSLNSGITNSIKEHIKNKKSAFDLYKNNIEIKVEDDEEEEDDKAQEDNPFLFYGENGFLNFINNFESYLNEENIDIKKIIYQNTINSQIINILKNLKLLLKLKDNSNIEDTINKDTFDDKLEDNENNEDTDNIKNNLSEPNIKSTPKKSIDTFDDIISKNSSKGKKSITPIKEEKKDDDDSIKENDIEYDLEIIINNNLKELNDEEDIMVSKHKKNKNDDFIINFPNFNIEKENVNEICENKNKIFHQEKIDRMMQYYLFINYYLEEIKKDEILKNRVVEEINQIYNIKINLDKLIVKIYKLAFQHSGKKHRDFPYFNFYEYLMGLNLDNLEILEKNIDKSQFELYDIFNYVYKEKKNLFEKEKINLINSAPSFPSRSNTVGGFMIQSDNINLKNYIPERQRSSIKIDLNDKFAKNHNIKEETEKIEIKEDHKLFKISKEYIINEESDFEPLCEPGSTHILHELCALIVSCFPTSEDIKEKTINEILEETNKKLNTQTFKELVGELRIIDLAQLANHKSKICFWLNCFNFLLLYTIFYKKWNISDEKSWKSFLKNVKYNIGGNCFSFNDMQYILFNKVYFFSSNYKPRNAVKNNLIDHKIKTLNSHPFLLYLPTKEFFKPIIYEEQTLEKDLHKRKEKYINNFITIENKKINITELLLSYEPNFFNNKILSKYKDILNKSLYDLIIKRQYSDISSKSLKWEMNFDFLHEEFLEQKES